MWLPTVCGLNQDGMVFDSDKPNIVLYEKTWNYKEKGSSIRKAIKLRRQAKNLFIGDSSLKEQCHKILVMIVPII